MSTARRPAEEIHSRADELAVWFEGFDPSEAHEVPVAEYLLERAARAQTLCEREVALAVGEARAGGATWCRIGEILGVGERHARETYGSGEDQPAETGTAHPVEL
ncbi:hypothetical protein [Candidatus Poriferisodalis sp.]|uniref:hypothetical protein n=1 Tax=Candidatus Poriferisodalis sp. TaxID=3101277 RepID=UPI003B02DC1D